MSSPSTLSRGVAWGVPRDLSFNNDGCRLVGRPEVVCEVVGETAELRAMLDAHDEVRCGEETRVVPRILQVIVIMALITFFA